MKFTEEHKRKIGLAKKGRKRLDMIGNTHGFKKGIPAWNKGLKVQTNTGRTHFKKGQKPNNYTENIINCLVCGQRFHRKPSHVKEKNFCSRKCQKTWESQNKRGENNPFWQGGTTGKRHVDMGRMEYKQWRKSVFERDGYTCQVCKKVGGELNAHHIKSYAQYPELRYETNNGITLCVDCHRLTFKIN